MKKILLAAGLICVMLSLAAEGRWEEEPYVPADINRTLDADTDGIVYINNVAGWIKIQSWDRAQVKVKGELGSAVKDFIFDNRGRKTDIRVVLPKNLKDWSRNYNAYLTITVPENSEVDINTVSASIEVNDVQRELNLKSISGSIDIDSDCEYLTVNTVSGSINLTGDTETIRMETVSGSIDIKGITTELRGNSVSGSLKYTGGAIELLNFKTTSGSINAFCQPQRKARIDLNSLSGSVDLIMPRDVEARFTLKSFSGSLDYIRFIREVDKLEDDAMVTKNGHREVRFVSGSGDARITVESFSGHVSLKIQ